MPEAPHPESVIRWGAPADLDAAGAAPAAQRVVQLKVHQCDWSGQFPANSLPAIQECYREHVARAEVDLAILSDTDFLVVHDLNLAKATNGSGRVDETRCQDTRDLRLVTHAGSLTAERPPLLSEVVDLIAAEPYPTILELDLKDWNPWPWPRVEELARMLQPVKDRITFGGGADWNLRRLLHLDPTMPMGFTITQYFDWVPESQRADALPGVRGAYGYLDAHPLARARLGPTTDYLRDRLSGLLQLVPNTREVHIRLLAVEQMIADGLTDLAELVHEHDMLLDVWTLNAGTPDWQSRLEHALAIGADVITSGTPRELAREYLRASS